MFLHMPDVNSYDTIQIPAGDDLMLRRFGKRSHARDGAMKEPTHANLGSLCIEKISLCNRTAAVDFCLQLIIVSLL